MSQSTQPPTTPSLAEFHRSVPIPLHGNWLRRMLAFAGFPGARRTDPRLRP